jgi:hypothetical protein
VKGDRFRWFSQHKLGQGREISYVSLPFEVCDSNFDILTRGVINFGKQMGHRLLC